MESGNLIFSPSKISYLSIWNKGLKVSLYFLCKIKLAQINVARVLKWFKNWFNSKVNIDQAQIYANNLVKVPSQKVSTQNESFKCSLTSKYFSNILSILGQLPYSLSKKPRKKNSQYSLIRIKMKWNETLSSLVIKNNSKVILGWCKWLWDDNNVI